MSDRLYRHLEMERVGETAVMRLSHTQFDDAALDELGAELARPVDEDGCRNVVLILGPREPECLYSVFLAKMLNLHRRLEANGGKMILADVAPLAMNVIRTSGLERFLRIEPNREAALASIATPHS